MIGAIAGAVQGVIGGIQSIIGGAKARKAQRQLEGMIDSYQPNQSIMDYYNKALQKYNVNPYQSQFYQNQQNRIGRNLATGIGATQDRRVGIGSIGSLVQGANDASAQAGAMAQQQQSQDLAQLGQATGMKSAEDKYKFEAKYNLLSQKAGAANATANAGMSNLYGGIGAIGDAAMIKKMYGGQKTA